MIKRNQKKLKQFYRELLKRETLSYKQALAVYEALHREAISLGVIGSNNILHGLEVDLHVAKTIHSLKA